jgi:flagellar biosynthesis/type III secretory pathway M-ring protein FliF/YscJ
MKQNSITNKLLIIFLIMSLIIITPIYATSLDDAKVIVNNYYLYSQQKDVEKYSLLFDEEYLVQLYGNDYKTLFREVFTYFNITKYEIDFQQYTESDESLSLFFNLEANTIVDGEKINMDNDLVALFSKNNGELKLKYIILQETFIEQMNREVIYNSAIGSFVEENSDLIKEAESKNIPLVDYKTQFEDMINKKDNHGLKIFLWIFIVVLILVVIAVLFKEKIKHKKTRKYLDKTENVAKKTGKVIKDKYNEAVPIIASKSKKIFNGTKNFIKKRTKKSKK